MKKLILTFLLFPFFLSAQVSSDIFNVVTSGSTDKKEEIQMRLYSNGNAYMIDNVKDENRVKVYLVRRNESLNKDLYIEKYDIESSKVIESKTIRFLDENSYFYGFHEIDNHIYALYTEKDQTSNSIKVMYKKINHNSLSIGEPAELFVINNKLKGLKFTNGFSVPGLFLKASEDNSKLLVVTEFSQEKTDDHANYDQYGLFVFDADLKELSGEVYQMKYVEAKMKNEKFHITNTGDVYMTAKIFNSNIQKDFIKKSKNYHYEVFSFKSLVVKNIDISNASINIRNVDFYFNSNNVFLICVGDKENSSWYNGTYYASDILTISIDEDLNILNSQVTQIPLKQINEYEKQSKKLKTNVKGFKIKNVVFEDEKLIFIAQEEYSYGDEKVYYVYGDVYYGILNTDLELKSFMKLPKNQKHLGKTGSNSFTFLDYSDDIYLFFIDNKENIDLKKSDLPELRYSEDDGVFSAFIINKKTGDSKVERIFDLSLLKKNSKGKNVLLKNIHTYEILTTENGILFDASITKKERIKIYIEIND